MSDKEQPAGKGRPTPKRREAEKRRRAATPTNRKEAAKLRRERLRKERALSRQALVSGDERYLPPRDAGPVKRFARDYVDSRFTFGQVFFGVILAVFVLTLIPSPELRALANVTLLLIFFLLIGDAIRVGRGAQRAADAKFGVKEAAGVTTYALMRSLQPRRMRRPPAKVKRGGTAV